MSSGNRTAIASTVLFIGAAFISVLWHELGHAFFQRKYGARPEIRLYGMGGVAIGHGARFSRWQHVIVASMGPIFGLWLWGVFWIIERKLDLEHLSPAFLFFQHMLWINLFWSLLNLLPVFPLDGGHILSGLIGLHRVKLVSMIGCAVGVGAAIFLFTQWGSIYGGIMFGLLAFQNFQRARGENPKSILGS